jgi:thiamine biosynthesis lipoprotein
MTAAHIAFRAMSTDVSITVVGGDTRLVEWARTRVEQLESRWSRFRPDSEISRLNRADGKPLVVSPDTLIAVTAACAAWSFTGGRFDPTVHDAMLRLGYDRSIETMRGPAAATASAALPAPGCSGIVLDEVTSVVQLPAGVHLDLGGIGKGLTADMVVDDLLARGATGATANIGGDIRVAGTTSTGRAWRIEIEDPRSDRVCAVVELHDGGVASSATLRRHWRLGSTVVHHMVDPRTGSNPAAAVVGVTVVAGTAAWADALSKVPFIDRSADLGAASAVIFTDDGEQRTVGDVPFHRMVAA